MHRFLSIAFSSLLLACSSNIGDGGSPDAAPAPDQPDDSDAAPAADGDVCGSLLASFSPIKPTVLLVVDRSGSMKADYGGPTRWDALHDTLMDSGSGIVTQLAGKVRFGILLYDGHDGDAAGACPTLHDVGPAIDNAEEIEALYGTMLPGEGTPTGQAIAAGTPMLAAVDKPGPKLLILATDGLPDTCDAPTEDSSAQARGAVMDAVEAAYDLEIGTTVIGVGPDISAEHLQEVANAGAGLPAGGADDATYYQALDAQALVDAFDDIIDGARGCVFTLDNPVDPDIAQGVVTLDGEVLEQGTEWKLRNGGAGIKLLGEACEAVLAGGNHEVAATFTCPEEPESPADAGPDID
jgi:hypothetical protein